ncbi:pre-rRNA processing [Knufia obscura]|uniref:Pre-rRNA processing n=1 Tax=Knufia obscura TaxID=1635080 RepID=A0ABR0RAD5_9EURO|nr:pre-rRNA processing [Knufia obscura]
MEAETRQHDEVPTADEFWAEIESVLAKQCETHDHIDDSLRSYLALLEAHHREYVDSDDHLAHCAYLLYASPLFTQHASYIRQQLVYCLLQEEDVNVLRIAVTFLLADARENEQTFEMLNKEGTFPRLVELVAHPREHEEQMHRTLMELMYEVARIQKITNDDLTCINDDFVCGLFDIIEQVSDDVNDPYHYPVIRLLLVLNEQFMVAAHDPAVLSKKSMPLTNKVVKVLSSHGNRYKTFGENIILLINREDETSLQLLTLKLMYLLFTTPPTYEYFYTNDLRVLVDILVRNLLDLPEYAAALRHTYLRVLYPLLEHTQLQYPPYYKREEIRKLLALLCGDRVENEDGSPPVGAGWNHFEDVDETTRRLVRRCQTVSWLSDPETSELVHVESPTEERTSEPDSPVSPSKPKPPQLPAPRKLRKRDSSKGSTLTIGQFLTPQLEAARQSSVSMAEMAQQKEKPGVITPSRNPSVKQGLRQAMFAKKEKPPPPKARRSGFMRPKAQPASTELEVTRLGVPEKTHTPAAQRNEAERYEDAVEEQEEEEVAMEKIGVQDEAKAVPTAAEEIRKPAPKKPPPAPKARRGWRMRKSRDGNEMEEERKEEKKEPGRFSVNMPSINTNVTSPFSPPAEGVPESSPFSPVKEKTLDPLNTARSPMSPESNGPKRSVSDAMHRAQEQATQQVEECLEHTHLSEDGNHLHTVKEESSNGEGTRKSSHPIRTSSLQQPQSVNRGGSESPTLQRTVLAPPGQAPIRGVPGPRVELEKSPFLSDDEEEKETVRDVPAERPRMKTKESREDFDVDHED